jgi:phosphoglycolate phosphatase
LRRPLEPGHSTAIYVGDTPADIVGARGAGAVAVMVPSGPSDADELRAAGADVVLDTLFDFPTWLASWLAPPSAASSGAARLATTPGP